MKVTMLLLLICLGLCFPAEHQLSASHFSLTSLDRGTQNPDIEESSRLSQAVVKLFSEGKYDEAYPVAKRALELREKALGDDDERVLKAVLDLAEVQWQRGKYDEAKHLFERAWHGYERVLGTDNKRLANVWDRLAVVYFAFGQPQITEKLYKQSLAVREKSLGEEHPETTQALFNLAELYQIQGDYKKAEPLYKRLLDVRTRTGAAAEAIAEAIDRYACLLRKEKRTEEAERMELGVDVYTRSSKPADLPMSGGILNSKAINLVQPNYPYVAGKARVNGSVTVRIVIDETGRVIRVCAISGPKLFMKESESAAARSKFTPTMLDGKPVKVTGTIIYNYVAR